MSERAYRILGLSPNTPKAEVRKVWQRLAAELHPDVNPAPDATRRFRRALRAYRTIMADRPMARRTRARRAPAPLVCPCCHDGFTYGSECPRCVVPLVARGSKTKAPPTPEVDALIAELERPKVPPLFAIDPDMRVPLLASLLAVFAWGQAQIGMTMLAAMSLSFVVVALAGEAIRRRTPDWLR
ncbi:MAG: J domain-containing protein [Myxococcota bacterium]